MAASKTKRSKLPPKQKKFCEEYCKTLNATASYMIAFDCDRETARKHSHILKQNVDIQAEIGRIQAASSIRTEVSQDKVLKELAHVAFSDITDIVEFRNNEVIVKDSRELSRDITSSIKKFTISRSRNTKENTETIETKIEVHDKMRALDKLSSYLGMTNDFNMMMATARKYGFHLYLDKNGNLRSERIENAEVTDSASDTEESIADLGDSAEAVDR